MDQEKFLATRIDNPISYKEAFDRIMAWSDSECRLILFGLLLGFSMEACLNDLKKRRELCEIIYDPTRRGGDRLPG